MSTRINRKSRQYTALGRYNIIDRLFPTQKLSAPNWAESLNPAQVGWFINIALMRWGDKNEPSPD